MCEAFQITAAENADRVALRTADGAVSITWAQYAERARRIAGGLAALGVGRGDTVALMTTNRPEFHLIDTAAFHLGATPFSVYNTSSPEQIEYLFSNAQNRIVIVEEQFLPVVRKALERMPSVERIVCVDGAPQGTTSLEELEAMAPEGFDLREASSVVEPDDVLTLIYTSGTTGPPKGVQTTHANMIAQGRGAAAAMPIPLGARVTSYLPLAHIADRWAHHYNSMLFGFEITSVSDPRQVAAVLPEVRPTFWGCVPRILEKMKAGLEAAMANEPDERVREATLGAIEVGRSSSSSTRPPRLRS
jgi:long-subunit acyl-CoA synthetase (AMP-forming)